MIDPDLGLESDGVLGALGVGLLAYGIGARHFGIAGTGAVLAGWFGGLAMARLGGLVAVLNSLQSTVKDDLSGTANTNGAGQGTP